MFELTILVMFVMLLLLGLFVGGFREQQHLRRLQQREERLAGMLVSQLRGFPQAAVGDSPAQMLVAEAVISSDYLKTFLAALRNLFGGEVRSLQTLLERARREALLRILEQAEQLGYNAVCNVRFETAEIGQRNGRRGGGIVMATILASATAYHYEPNGRSW